VGCGISEVIFLFGAVGAVVLIEEHLGFGVVEAAQAPLAVDEVVDKGAGFGGSGAVVLVILGDEQLEVGEVFVGEDQGAGVDAGFEGILGGDGFACDRGRAGGLLGVAAVGFNLTNRGHKLLVSGQAGGSSYVEDSRLILGIRGVTL